MTDALHLAELVADADLVITGEGRIDSQTIHGKVPVGVAKVAQRYNVPVIAIAGSLTADVGIVHRHRAGCGIQRDLFGLYAGGGAGERGR